MEGKLIKTSKDSHHNGHYFLNDDNGFAIGSSDKDWCKRAVKKRPLYVLSLTNCQAIERGYDLDELAKSEAIKISETEVRDEKLERIYKRGFQKALVILGDRKFTEEDMKRAFEVGEDFGSLPFSSYSTSKRLNKKEFIQSLQQTEWDVIFDPEEKDAEGRLILKKK